MCVYRNWPKVEYNSNPCFKMFIAYFLTSLFIGSYIHEHMKKTKHSEVFAVDRFMLYNLVSFLAVVTVGSREHHTRMMITTIQTRERQFVFNTKITLLDGRRKMFFSGGAQTFRGTLGFLIQGHFRGTFGSHPRNLEGQGGHSAPVPPPIPTPLGSKGV